MGKPAKEPLRRIRPKDEDFPVADPAGAGNLRDQLDRFVEKKVVDTELDPRLRNEFEAELFPLIGVEVPLLAAVSSHLFDMQCGPRDGTERLGDRFHPKWFDDGDDVEHSAPPIPRALFHRRFRLLN